ncbi:MAG TPA: class I tRNA ligase family protein, partial [Sphingomicrobium sp.]
VESPIPELVGAHAVVWTTTPWTIPVNQGIAYNPDVEYRIVDCWLHFTPDDTESGMGLARVSSAQPWFYDRQRFLVAADLVPNLEARLNQQLASIDVSDLGIDRVRFVLESATYDNGKPLANQALKGSELAGTIARHPMHKLGGFFARPRPFLPGDFVTTDQGTGLVHMAPDHGEDDFELCRAHGIDPVFAVDAGGFYRPDWLWLGGQGSVINAKFNAPDGPICSDLREAGALLAASADFRHSYPHSWRSKAKVIYRCTPQWFIAMDKPLAPPPPSAVPLPTPSAQGGFEDGSSSLSRSDGEGDRSAQPSGGGATLRQLAMQAIADTRFVPEKGRNRLGAMVEGRPDWVISRQRAWGVPIALFVEKKTGELLVDPEVNARIVEAVRRGGVDAWDAENAAHFLGNRNPDDYEMVTDILDVWFDSGCTHVFTLESGHWPEERWPADLYLEGSDQHRGWFQSSLLESCGTRGRAPYDAVLTHGFTMDSKGMKMSKSLGNTVDPLKVMETYGADIIRLWALSVDFTEDHRIGDEILGGVADQYRKLRNTFRYLLGALHDFDGDSPQAATVPMEAMPELERYVLHLTAELDKTLRQAVADFDFNTYVRALTDFCNEDLSAFYFDIRKDVLYCEINAETGVQTDRRRANRTVLDILFHALVRWLAPVLVFTTEEVWGTRFPEAGSVHLLEWLEVPAVDADDAKWTALRALRERVTEAIEPLRKDKVLGSSLEAEVTVPSDADPALLAELFITSTVRSGDEVKVTKTENRKCERCRRYMPDVDPATGLDARCQAVLNG